MREIPAAKCVERKVRAVEQVISRNPMGSKKRLGHKSDSLFMFNIYARKTRNRQTVWLDYLNYPRRFWRYKRNARSEKVARPRGASAFHFDTFCTQNNEKDAFTSCVVARWYFEKYTGGEIEKKVTP